MIYFTTDPYHINSPDRNTVVDGFPLAGSGLYTGLALDNNVPGTIMSLWGSPTFVAALYGGTSSGSLRLQATSTIDNWDNEGSVVPVNVILAGLPAGTPAWFQIQVYDNRAGSAADAWARPWVYAGVSQIFQATPQAADYDPIYAQSPSPVNSTWAPGAFVPVDFADLGGFYGAIAVYANVVPEPGTFALVGLGAAGLMIFRRRR
jgi:hypothetical protein